MTVMDAPLRESLKALRLSGMLETLDSVYTSSCACDRVARRAAGGPP
ncbi:hypothetical protein ACWEQ7_34055 [Streptomyces sp. NPDC004069]